MDTDLVGQSVRDAMWVATQIGAPVLLALLAVGLVVSVVQALTQIQEASLAFVPKLAVTGAAMLLLGPYMLGALRGWTTVLMDRVVAVGGLP